MRILIARHGETVWNVERRIQGWTDSKLSVVGTQQAQALADRLKDSRISAIYSSDLGRAITTAACVALWHGKDVIPMKELRETSWGDWEGLTSDDIAQRFPVEWAKFRDRDDSSSESIVEQDFTTFVPGGETIAQASERLNRGLDTIIAKHKEAVDPVLIVGHGGSLRFLLTRTIGIAPAYARRFHIDNASLSEICVIPDQPWVIHGVNDISHLIRPAK